MFLWSFHQAEVLPVLLGGLCLIPHRYQRVLVTASVKAAGPATSPSRKPASTSPFCAPPTILPLPQKTDTRVWPGSRFSCTEKGRKAAGGEGRGGMQLPVKCTMSRGVRAGTRERQRQRQRQTQRQREIDKQRDRDRKIQNWDDL